MFDFQMEKSLPTHENYYVNLNDYFIAYTYNFNGLFLYNFFSLWVWQWLLYTIYLQWGSQYIHPFFPRMPFILWKGPLWKPL